TAEDVDAAHELAKIAGVDVETYGLEMLKAGTDLSDKSIKELLTMDAKSFSMGGANVEIAQVNTIDLAKVYEHQADLAVEMNDVILEKDLELFLVDATDILNSKSEVLAVGSHQQNVLKALSVSIKNNRAQRAGGVCRKKQLVTNVPDVFE